MKLYNLYQTIILEEIIKLTQLNEAVSTNDIDNVLKGDPTKQGKFYHVSFNYVGDDGKVTKRWVQIYQRNISTANNGLIDAYQVSVDGKNSTPTNEASSSTGWKKFKLDNMSNFQVSKVPFYQEPEPYTVYNSKGEARVAKLNKTGNNSRTVKTTFPNIAAIGTYQYADTTKKQKAATEKRKQQTTEPVTQQQQATAQPNEKTINQEPVTPKQTQQKQVKPITKTAQPKTNDNLDKTEDELNNI